jgi:hypothetical protein
LSHHGIDSELGATGHRLEPTRLADAAAGYTVVIECR